MQAPSLCWDRPNATSLALGDVAFGELAEREREVLQGAGPAGKLEVNYAYAVVVTELDCFLWGYFLWPPLGLGFAPRRCCRF